MKELYYINGKDAYTEYGVILDYDSLGNLLAPPPLKEAIENDVPSEHGVSQSIRTPKVNKRTLTLIFHLYADNPAQAMEKYQAFCAVLLAGAFKLKVGRTGITYHLQYRSSTGFVPWFAGVAKYTLSLVEPNPMNHTP